MNDNTTANDQPISNRYDFTFLFDVTNGNPNGDPQLGNLPRTDIDTGIGLVTDVCLKRKVRDYIDRTRDGHTPNAIYIRRGTTAERLNVPAARQAGANIPDNAKLGTDTFTKALKAAKKDPTEQAKEVHDYLCANYFDVRAFGAVLTSFSKALPQCSHITGPIQLGMARSIDPVDPQSLQITRVSAASEDQPEGGTFGDKTLIPYGLYRVNGSISPNEGTGLTRTDIDLFFEALTRMFDMDHAAARGEMAARDLYIFKHESRWGNAPSHVLFDRLKIIRRDGVEIARSFNDYEVSFDDNNLPNGVTAHRINVNDWN
jgi:CRISPR-associated protein Csd2